MSDENVPSPKRRRWFQFRLRTLLIFTAVVALTLGLLMHYRVHLAWRFAGAGLGEVRAIPVSPMPDEPIPDDWVACRFGSLHFRLPPDLAKTAQSAGSKIFLSGNRSRQMIVAAPEATTEYIAFLRTNLSMPPEGRDLSPVGLRIAVLQTDSSDFHWGMTRQEAAWFAWRASTGRLMRFKSEQHAETLSGEDLEQVAVFLPDSVVLEWHAAGREVGGYIHFIDRSDSAEIEPGWVRAVCRSLRCTGEPFPNCTTMDEVLAQFEILDEPSDRAAAP